MNNNTYTVVKFNKDLIKWDPIGMIIRESKGIRLIWDPEIDITELGNLIVYNNVLQAAERIPINTVKIYLVFTDEFASMFDDLEIIAKGITRQLLLYLKNL
jgi:hypothetical protein